MSSEKITLVCKRVLFYYSPVDKEMLMFGLQKISCIEKMERVHDELLLHLSSPEVSLPDHLALQSIFKRYKIRNPEQLDQLKVIDIDEGDPDAE